MKPILIIDDDKDFVRELKDTLKNNQFTYNWVRSSKYAKRLLEEQPCMIIIDTCLDYPTEGFKFINTLRNPYGKKHYEDIPILVVTDIEKSTGIQFKKIAGTRLLPVDGYLQKPVRGHEVLAEIKRILSRGATGESVFDRDGEMIILCLNCGSSSVKYKLYNWDKKETMANGVIERVGQPKSICLHEVPEREKVTINKDCPLHGDAVELVLKILTDKQYGVIRNLHEIRAVGHRVVHGGEKFAKSVVIDDEAMEMFEDLIDLAPLHNPPNIIGIKTARALIPDVPHVAVMDTAWHQTIPEHIYTYALPYEWYQEHRIRRYGFHGTSLLYVSKRCAVLLGKDPFDCNLVVCHIGNGVSLNAVKYGVSYDTSMGFTPLEGLVMGTRAGDHDAAVDLYMMQKHGYTPEQMNTILNKKSGILGISGQYIDQRDLLAACERNDPRARLARDIECYRLKKYIGAYVAALGKIDALVFTAGVGEMGDCLRAEILDGLEGIGIKYCPVKNRLARTRNGECEINASDSKVKIFVIPTDEERVFIEDVAAAVEKSQTGRIKFSYRFQFAKYSNRLRDNLLAEELKMNPRMRDVIAEIPTGG
jgi:acetate kinase